MIGFPDYIKDPQKLKEKYEGVSVSTTIGVRAGGARGAAAPPKFG